MPRKSRINAACALQHIIARGIDRGKIFQDPTDKRNFLDRLGEILKSTDTRCHAWALIPNHFHLLLRKNRQCSRSYGDEKVVDRPCAVVQPPAPALRTFVSKPIPQ